MIHENEKVDRLLKVLGIVTDWLRFAESKNGALIAFNGASIYGITNILGLDFIKASPFLSGYAVMTIVLLGLSVVFSLVSFVPKLKLGSTKPFSGVSEPNSLFFEHLKSQSEMEIFQAICGNGETEFSRFEKDIANRIKHYADITSEKYYYFTIAVWITVSAYITPIIAGILAIYLYQRRKG